jgi:hypothetical protein
MKKYVNFVNQPELLIANEELGCRFGNIDIWIFIS